MSGRWGSTSSGLIFDFTEEEGDTRGDRWRGKWSRELIRDCQQILLTVAFRSGTPGDGNRDVALSVTGAKNEHEKSSFASLGSIYEPNEEIVSDGFRRVTERKRMVEERGRKVQKR